MIAPATGLVLVLAQAATPAATQPEIRLPKPAELAMPLGAALRARRSTRSFDTAKAISREQLATLLWAATGVNRPDPGDPRGGKRTAPSAYGSDAVDVIVTSREGTFRYDPARHALVPHASSGGRDLRARLTAAKFAQTAPVLVLLVAHYDRYPERVTPKAGQEYARADAGVIGQNLYLACAALGLGTVITASAPDDADATLELDAHADTIFVMPIGTPKG